jgi:hypothetical protein
MASSNVRLLAVTTGTGAPLCEDSAAPAESVSHISTTVRQMETYKRKL